MGRVIFKRLGKGIIGGNTAFVVTAFADNHVIWAVVIGKNGFKRGLGKAETPGDIKIKSVPKNERNEDS